MSFRCSKSTFPPQQQQQQQHQQQQLGPLLDLTAIAAGKNANRSLTARKKRSMSAEADRKILDPPAGKGAS